MDVNRRQLIGLAGAAAISSATAQQPGNRMFGMIAKLTAAAGRREELIAILIGGAANLPGCLSYIVAKDANDAEAIWITEAWETKASHDESLTLDSVRDTVAKAKPLMAAFSDQAVTNPVGGFGLPR